MVDRIRTVSFDENDRRNEEKKRIKAFIVRLRRQNPGYQEAMEDSKVKEVSRRKDGSFMYDKHPRIGKLIGKKYVSVLNFKSKTHADEKREELWRVVVWDNEVQKYTEMRIGTARRLCPTVVAYSAVLIGFPLFFDFMEWCCNEDILPLDDYEGL